MRLIPPDKIEAVERSLREAFGVASFDDIHPVAAATTSNPVFRIVVSRTPYLLRINLRAGDVARHYACMRAAADAGLAPRVWYANADDRISITNFVAAVPLPLAEARARLPITLRALHALPPFAEAPNGINTTCTFLLDEGEALNGVLAEVAASAALPKTDIEELLDVLARVATAWPRNPADLVSCHNDLFKPDNIMFDGKRVWLVDWEAAFLNDRYADLAVVANMIVRDIAGEDAFLEAYLGAPPNDYHHARFFLARQLAHIFYTIAFLLLGSAVESSRAIPTFPQFQERFWAREIDLASPGAKRLFGRVHWERLRHNLRQPRFEDALKVCESV